VHGNLATLPITSNSSLLPTVNRVTWYRTDGSQSTFTDPNEGVRLTV
jgi:hypothetical protein